MVRRTTNGIRRTSGGVGRTTAIADAVTDGLVAWYKLDEGSGSTAFDYTNNYDGSINGAVWTTDAKTGGQALEFDGVDDEVNLGYVDGVENRTEISVTAWAKLFGLDNDQSSDNMAIYGMASDFDNYVSLWHEGNSGGNNWVANVENNGNTALCRSSWGITNEWAHVALTHDGDTTRLYVDGDLKDSDSGGDGVPDPTDEHKLGRLEDTDVWYFDGVIDDVRLFDRQLSDSEISQIYNNTK